jgi:hypothetical protein
LLPAAVAQDADRRVRFDRQARLLAALQLRHDARRPPISFMIKSAVSKSLPGHFNVVPNWTPTSGKDD